MSEPEPIEFTGFSCPECGHGRFIPGPRGGSAQNVECCNCLARFNVANYHGAVLGWHPIPSVAEGGAEWDHELLARLRAQETTKPH